MHLPQTVTRFLPESPYCGGGAKSYSIKLSREGLTQAILKLIPPFELKFSVLYTAYCCTFVMFYWELRQNVEYSVKFGNTAQYLEELEDLRNIHFTCGIRFVNK
ncbi:unnamed protein product [Orchesella dallaii]|uniref:Uncharacterized protein n=1 Tax=Orchesella dallaii TaxID=48710 RepID=A0ABP1RXD4_9HEXA